MTFLLKAPHGALDYRVEWGERYLGAESLSASGWSVLPVEAGGVTIDGSSFDAGSATVHVSGGQAGKCYRLVNHVATSSGDEDSRSILLRVEER